MSDNPFLKEFLPYNDNLIKSMNATFEEGRAKNANTLNYLRGYYIFVNFLVAEKDVFNDMPEGFKTLIAKGSLDLLGVHSTLSSGCLNQSISLIRSLFESNIYLTYINRDFEKLMSYYEGYTDFMKYHKWKDADEEDREAFGLSQQQIDNILQKYEPIKNNYRKRGHWYDKPLVQDMKNHSAFRNWRNKRSSFKAMCIITNQEETYDMLYTSTSESVHGSSLISTLLVNEQNNMSMAPKFDTFYIDSLSTLCIIFLSNMVEIGLKRQIEKGHKDYISYLDSSRKYVQQLL